MDTKIWIFRPGLALVLSAAMCGGATPTSPSTQPATQPSSVEVEKLVLRLGDDDWRTRENSEKRLILLGDDAEPRLHRVMKETGDEEVRARAEVALGRIKENRAAGASIITLNLNDVTPQAAFDEITRQARAELRPYPPKLWENRAWANVNVEADHLPFWEVMRTLCPKVGVYPRTTIEDQAMMLAAPDNEMMMGPSVVSGAFLVVASSVDRTASINLASPQKTDGDFQVQLNIFAEPKMRVLSANGTVMLEEAVDDKGHNLLPGGTPDDNSVTGSGWAWNACAKLQYPQRDKGCTKIARLRGALKFKIETRAERIEIADILAVHNVNKAIGGARVCVRDLKKRDEQYELTVTIFRESMDDERWANLSGGSYGFARLLDDEDRALMMRKARTTTEDRQVNSKLLFGKPAYTEDDGQTLTPTKLVICVPAETREVIVPFEFRDLPIP